MTSQKPRPLADMAGVTICFCLIFVITSVNRFAGEFIQVSLSQVFLGHMQNSIRNSVYTVKLKLTNPNPDPNQYRRRCPDPNARIQKFIHYMATTPLQNSMLIEFAHTNLHTTRLL